MVKTSKQPQDIAKQFFQSLMQGKGSLCWTMFSNHTQQTFLKWALEDIYRKNPDAAKAASIGAPEIKFMFENNDMNLKGFWKRFYLKSSAEHFFRYGYFDLLEGDAKRAVVQARLVYADGRTVKVKLSMFNERAGWRFGYIESGLPF